jgi:hypothetical protein
MAPPGRHGRNALLKAWRERARARGRRKKPKSDEITIDLTDPEVARRWRRWSLLAISVGTTGGIAWYVAAPGVASYQIGYTLALPGIITAIVWIGRRLPRWLDWAIAVALGAGGSLGYILVDGSRWWLWAQVALLPFVLLVLISGVKPPQPGERPSEPWYGGMQDGPWGGP